MRITVDLIICAWREVLWASLAAYTCTRRRLSHHQQLHDLRALGYLSARRVARAGAAAAGALWWIWGNSPGRASVC